MPRFVWHRTYSSLVTVPLIPQENSIRIDIYAEGLSPLAIEIRYLHWFVLSKRFLEEINLCETINPLNTFRIVQRNLIMNIRRSITRP